MAVYKISTSLRNEILLTEENIEECVEAFRILDLDNDGKVAVYELGLVMRAVGMNPTDVQLQQMVKEVDKNGGYSRDYLVEDSGFVEFGEFIQMIGRWKDLVSDSEHEIQEAFRMFDRDGDGFINAKELKQVMLNLGEKMTDAEIEEMIKEADVIDTDGKVSYPEFLKLMGDTR